VFSRSRAPRGTLRFRVLAVHAPRGTLRFVKIAFFDVDKTILSVNSATLWIRREMRLGHLSPWQALRGMLWGILYGLGAARMEHVIVSAALTLRGKRERDLHDRTLDFWREEVRGLIRPAARAAIAAHRARGDHVVLLTTSSTYLTREVAEELGCDAYLCNRLEVRDGRFTGRVEPPVCFGDGKAQHAAAFAASQGAALADCSYYGDSYSDLPVLLAVGEPVVVSPDLRLGRYARRRGWRIEDWDAPALPSPPPRLGAY
jgi:HAD superfamily hydrolase (TIGR01490 family)